MCGIFGQLNFDGEPVSEELLFRMSAGMVHRGPDDEGYFVNEHIGMGMRRLSIIDVVGGKQPVAVENGAVQIVFNGEIYNYIELREQLIARGHKFLTNSDTEVLAHLYQDYGVECVQKINGMFAVAVWDSRNNSLWLVRDRMGIKPLFYYLSDKSFYFSSDLNSLQRVVHAPVSQKSIISYLGYSYVKGPQSIFEGIKKLMPAEELIISQNGAVTRRNYWTLPKVEKKMTASYAASELDNLIDNSVKIELRSDVPVGVFLSGGVDSSAVATYASRYLNIDSFRTYTINFQGKVSEDAKYASILAKKLKSKHSEILFDFDDHLNMTHELLRFLDEPMSDSAIVPTYAIARHASNQGVKVMLSGAGGDEIFGGYDRHYRGKIGSASWIAALPASVKKLISPILSSINPSLNLRLHNRARNFFLATSGIDILLLSEIIKDKLLFQYLLDDFDSYMKCFDSDDGYSLMKVDFNTYLPDNILCLMDKASMGASVEARVPLLDHRIVEFCYSLPKHINLLKGEKKGLLKKVLENKLPYDVLNRRKEGFNAPVIVWINKWSPYIKEELLENPEPLMTEMFQLSLIDKWLRSDKIIVRAAELMYSLYILNRWLRLHAR